MTDADGKVAPAREEDELRELMRLMLGADRESVLRAVRTIEDRDRFVRALSDGLADAVRHRSSRDGRFADAIAPLVSKGVTETVQRDPGTFGRALAPAMGPAIRESVIRTFQGLVQNFERALEASLSPRSLRWRVQAWRTGRSFAELVFLNTLAYRVEHVFLIHRKTGLLLQEVSAPDAPAREPEVVSAMLTAIQDFVRDSFDGSPEDTLGSFQVGELTVRAEHTSALVLAAVVRGQAPSAILETMRATLDRIHVEWAPIVEDFDGDESVFDDLRPDLAGCLVRQQLDAGGERPRDKYTRDHIYLIFGLVGAALLAWWGLAWRERARVDAFVARLRAEPGITVTDTRRIDGRTHIVGHRDPLASSPLELAASAGFDITDIEISLEPIASLRPEFVVERANRVLRPPGTVTLSAARDGELRAAGSAPHEFVERLLSVGAALSPTSAVDASLLVDTDAEAVAESVASLAATSLTVWRDGTPRDADAMQAFARDVARLSRHAPEVDQRFELHADIWMLPATELSQGETSSIFDAIDAAIRDAGSDAAIVRGRASPWTDTWPNDRSSWPFVTFRVIRPMLGR